MFVDGANGMRNPVVGISLRCMKRRAFVVEA